MNPSRVPEKLLLLLVLITIGVLLFHAPLLETRLVITSSDDVHKVALDSDVQDGGNSKIEWLDREGLHWRCKLRQAWELPFCGMQIHFSASHLEGIDLSDYSHINLSLEYRGSGNSVRLFLRNRHPAYTKADEMRSTKFNMIELDTRWGPDYQDVKLDYFSVADWWLQLYELEIEHSVTDFSNVSVIEILSGTGLDSGVHEFKLNRLELVGVRFSIENLYLGIILVWICAISLYLALRIRALNVVIESGKAKEAELTEINALLDQRSQTLEERVKKDPLTGAYNRAGIEDSLTIAVHNWKYKHLPLSLLLLDVDHFKNVNDNHGHAVGDDVLRELSALVSDNIRAGDHFARWGGEEFILVCDNTKLAHAKELAEKLRELISTNSFSHQLEVTVSIGVAQIKRNETLEALFHRADRALYRAKENGRNRVRSASN